MRNAQLLTFDTPEIHSIMTSPPHMLTVMPSIMTSFPTFTLSVQYHDPPPKHGHVVPSNMTSSSHNPVVCPGRWHKKSARE